MMKGPKRVSGAKPTGQLVKYIKSSWCMASHLVDPELVNPESKLQSLIVLGQKFDELKDIDPHVLGPLVVQSREV